MGYNHQESLENTIIHSNLNMTQGKSSQATWVSMEVRINGLFHLLLNGVHRGYNPLILTIDPNFLGPPSTPSGKDRWLATPMYFVYHGPLRTLPPFGNGDRHLLSPQWFFKYLLQPHSWMLTKNSPNLQTKIVDFFVNSLSFLNGRLGYSLTRRLEA